MQEGYFQEADRFYQTVGQVVSQAMQDKMEREWLNGGRADQEES